jgi:sulfate/thiosulfate transport system ATP-binding protein
LGFHDLKHGQRDKFHGMSIVVRNIQKRFGATEVLKNVTMEAKSGSLVALLGPSGSGKTTLLRIIAGLETADAGQVLYDEDDVTRYTARERNVGFVFQHYALFRHMTVFENVAFGLRVRHWAKPRIEERVTELLKLVKLEELRERFPPQLSGGQRQRIALVRALAPQPRVILLDEPFGALDAKVRAELRLWLRRFHDEFHVTSIFVTHDQEEAFEVADQIVVMNQGIIEQADTPIRVFDNPATEFVMDFVGNVNKLPARIRDNRAMLGRMEIPLANVRVRDNDQSIAFVRPHEFILEPYQEASATLEVKVSHINPAGSVVKVRVYSEEFDLLFNVEVSPIRYAQLRLRPGDLLGLSVTRARVFEPEYAI